MGEFSRYIYDVCGKNKALREAAESAYRALMEESDWGPGHTLEWATKNGLTDRPRVPSEYANAVNDAKEDKAVKERYGFDPSKVDNVNSVHHQDGWAEAQAKYGNARTKAATSQPKAKDGDTQETVTQTDTKPTTPAAQKTGGKVKTMYSWKNGGLSFIGSDGKTYKIGWPGKAGSADGIVENYKKKIAAAKIPGMTDAIMNGAAQKYGSAIAKDLIKNGKNGSSAVDPKKAMVASAESATPAVPQEAANKEVAAAARKYFTEIRNSDEGKGKNNKEILQMALAKASNDYQKSNPGQGTGLQEAGIRKWPADWTAEQKKGADSLVAKYMAKHPDVSKTRAMTTVSNWFSKYGYETVAAKYNLNGTTVASSGMDPDDMVRKMYDDKKISRDEYGALTAELRDADENELRKLKKQIGAQYASAYSGKQASGDAAGTSEDKVMALARKLAKERRGSDEVKEIDMRQARTALAAGNPKNTVASNGTPRPKVSNQKITEKVTRNGSGRARSVEANVSTKGVDKDSDPMFQKITAELKKKYPKKDDWDIYQMADHEWRVRLGSQT